WRCSVVVHVLRTVSASVLSRLRAVPSGGAATAGTAALDRLAPCGAVASGRAAGSRALTTPPEKFGLPKFGYPNSNSDGGECHLGRCPRVVVPSQHSHPACRRARALLAPVRPQPARSRAPERRRQFPPAEQKHRAYRHDHERFESWTAAHTRCEGPRAVIHLSRGAGDHRWFPLRVRHLEHRLGAAVPALPSRPSS